MTWVRLDDGIGTHPKLRAVGAEAAWLWVCGIAFCNKHRTSGFISDDDLSALYPGKFSTRKLRQLARTLAESRLWERQSDGYLVHDYADFQRIAMPFAPESVQNDVHNDVDPAEKKRKKWREQKQNQRAKARSTSGTVNDSNDLPLSVSKGVHRGHSADMSTVSADMSLTGARAYVGAQAQPDPTRPDPNTQPPSPPFRSEPARANDDGATGCQPGVRKVPHPPDAGVTGEPPLDSYGEHALDVLRSHKPLTAIATEANAAAIAAECCDRPGLISGNTLSPHAVQALADLATKMRANVHQSFDRNRFATWGEHVADRAGAFLRQASVKSKDAKDADVRPGKFRPQGAERPESELQSLIDETATL